VLETLRHAALVAVAGLGLGLAGNALSPRPAPLGRPVHAAAEGTAGACVGGPSAAPARSIPRISAGEAAAMCSACTAGFVDARSARDYEAGHVPGAIHLPPVGHPDEAAVLARLAALPAVIVYDDDRSCALAEGVARRLQQHGLREVRVLEGAWPAWVAAGGPGASGACHLCQHGLEASR
jgi:rhodanese-related sulfurtransferase